jgi:DNA primase
MPRIPEDVIARLKRDVDLKALVERAGVALRRQGKDWVGVCPLHSDSEASLSVNPEKGSWHCFGCDRGGSVIDWTMAVAGTDFRGAVLELAAEFLPGVVIEATTQTGAATRGAPAVGDADAASAGAPVEPLTKTELDALLAASNAELLRWVVRHYHERGKANGKVAAYLESRGLAHPQLVDRFSIGVADRTLGLRLPEKKLKAGAAIRGRLQALGILREGSGHEHLVGRLVIPVFDAAGDVVQIYGRVIRTDLRPGTPDHLYLPAPQRGIFHRQALASTEVILCESMLDALTFWCAGFHQVTATYGANGFGDELREALLGHGVERVLVAFDHDEAGERGAAAVAETLGHHGIACWRVVFPRGLDANAYAQRTKPVAKALDFLLRHAVWMGSGAAPERPAIERAELAELATVVEASPVDASAVEAAVLAGAAAPAPTAPFLAAEPLAGAAPAAPASSPATLTAELPAAPAPIAPASPTSPVSAPTPAAATLLPAGPPPAIPCERIGEDVVITLGDRVFRVRGLAKNLSFDALKVNVLVRRGEAFHVDTLDLCSSRQRAAFAKQGAKELGMREEALLHELGRVYLALEGLQEAAIKEATTPKPAAPPMTPAERDAALELLRDPRLLERIVEDLERVGIVGETINKLVCYLATVSRKQAKPLGVLIQSSSAAGKSSLMRAVLEMVPAEERVAYSAMTGQSLYYMSEKDLRHKVLAIAEEEGAEKASYALKLLLSEGELSIASTGKDPHSGKLVTHEYTVEGPVAVLSTTTSIEVDEELLNRCLVLTVDEDREQTRAIHRAQRESETLEGQLLRLKRPAVVALHQNAQRLLRPLLVFNPFAAALTYPDSAPRTRRDHEKYLGLIRAVALLHQAQRATKTTNVEGQEVAYIETTAHDVAVANRLARLVLGRSLDELPPQTRRLLVAIDQLVRTKSTEQGMARSEVRFTRREVRAFTGWGHTQIAIHCARLEALEYVVAHRGRQGQGFVYELAYEPEPGGRVVLAGLIDEATLGYDGNLPGFLEHLPESVVEFPGRFRPVSGGIPGGYRDEQTPAKPGVVRRFEGRAAGNRLLGSRRNGRRRSADRS